MCVKFTKKQKQFILERIKFAKKCAKDCQIRYNDDTRAYAIYLLGALEPVLGDLCDVHALDLFKSEV